MLWGKLLTAFTWTNANKSLSLFFFFPKLKSSKWFVKNSAGPCVCVCACEENKKVTQSVAPNKHNLQSLRSDSTASVCWYHTCLCVSHFQTPWWNHARTRASVRRPTAAAQEQRWSVALVTIVTDPTRAIATETTTATVQGLWSPAHSCSWRPCYCAQPSVSCEQLRFSL